jgi:hypothetical protein
VVAHPQGAEAEGSQRRLRRVDRPQPLHSDGRAVREARGEARAGRPVRVIARAGVVLACGGFPQDRARRQALFPHAPTGREHFSPAPEENTGDGLRLAAAAGAALTLDLPNAAAWVPVSRVPRRDGSFGVFPHFIDRAKPGVIAVTRAGLRFCNEADSYHDFVQAMQRTIPAGKECTAFLLADQVMARYGEEGWTCVKAAPGGDAEPLGGVFIKEHCEKSTPARHLIVDRALYRHPGADVGDFVNSSEILIEGVATKP